MSKHIISVAATGLPEASRRTALAGAAALLATACFPRAAKAAEAAQPEPIVVLIDRYRTAIRTFNASDSNLTDAEFDAMADATYRPLLRELRVGYRPSIRALRRSPPSNSAWTTWSTMTTSRLSGLSSTASWSI